MDLQRRFIGGLAKGRASRRRRRIRDDLSFLKQITTDTNISTAVVDWNSSTPVSTNHCVISGISRSGNTLTFTRHDDRLPFAWDVSPLMGITNDCNQAFVLNPSDGNYFQFTIGIQNIPTGTYSVLIDGQFVGAYSSADLAAGWNMFTNTVGPYWAQRTEVLGRIRDKEHVDRYSRLPGSASDGQGMISYESFGNMYFTNSAYRGDALINILSNRVANVMAWDALTVQAAQPTNHTFIIMPYAPTPIIKVSAPTNAFNVPVILDGSSSVKATSYYWEQISGLPQLEMIGQGTSKPMLISVTNAGTYTFRLTVSDGESSVSSGHSDIYPTGRAHALCGQAAHRELPEQQLFDRQSQWLRLGRPRLHEPSGSGQRHHPGGRGLYSRRAFHQRAGRYRKSKPRHGDELRHSPLPRFVSKIITMNK